MAFSVSNFTTLYKTSVYYTRAHGACQPHQPWLAVDNPSWLYRPFCKSLFLTDARTGLRATSGALLVARMQKLL